MAEGVNVLERMADAYRRVRKALPVNEGNYPYVTARVRAKKSLLIPREAYARMLQMELPEIARLIGEGEYRREVVALGARYSGVDLIEMATSRNLAATFTQIYEFSEGRLQVTIGAYLDKFDLRNVITILRGKVYGADPREISEDLIPAGSLDEGFLRELAAAEGVEEVFARLEGTIYGEAIEELGTPPAEVENWAEYEDLLARKYYARLLESIAPTTEPNRLFLGFIRREIDLVNLKTLLRLRGEREKLERPVFVPGGEHLTVEHLETLVKEDLPGLMDGLRRVPIYERIAEDLPRVHEIGVSSVIRGLEKGHMTETAKFANLHPLSVLPVLDYIVAKEREIQNVRILARGKESGLPNDLLQDLLVV